MKPKIVLCMKWGTRYGPEYVNKLYREVAKHLSPPFRFICFTDDPSGLDGAIETLPLPLNEIPGTEDLRWRKLGVFRKDLFGLSGRALFLDIDTVVTGSLDALFDFDAAFVALHEFTLFPRPWYVQWRRRLLKPRRYRWATRECNTSVFAFDIGSCDFILDAYLQNAEWINRTYRREQEFVARELDKRKMLAYWPGRWCVSFKENCLLAGERGLYGKRHLPADARIVVFVGHMDMAWALAHRERLSKQPDALQWLADIWEN